MARNAPTYPELAKAPSLCKDKAAPYFRIDPVEVVAPYKGRDSFSVPVVGIVNADDPSSVFELFEPLQDTLEDQGPGTLGWESEVELGLLVDVIAEAQDTAEAASAYDIDGASGVANMAKKAEQVLGQIADTYQNFRDNVIYQIKQGDATVNVTFPLSVPEEDFDPLPGFTTVETLDAARIQARANIVRWWDHGLSLLWCAQIGLAQLESYTENQKAQGGLAQPGDTGRPPTAPGDGFGLAAEGPEPGPRPGDDLAPSFPDPGEPADPGSIPGTSSPKPSGSGGSSGGGAAFGIAALALVLLAIRK